MELWYTEEHTENVRFSMKVKQHLYSGKSEFQQIDVLETEEFGRVLVLDGYVMLTEKDEFIYHDMIVHIPMAANADIKNVLVIGAGDGGTVRELVRYSNVESIEVVEIDETVVDVCKRLIPSTASSFGDDRVKLFFRDGLKYVREKENEYDLIIVDSTDPFGPGEGLFTREFYGNCYKALKKDGILVNQHESPFYDNDALAMQRAHRRIAAVFPICCVYQAHIPTYPSGHWLFGYASKGIAPINENLDKWNELKLDTKYYNTQLHRGAFALPNYVNKLLSEDV